MTGNAAFRRKVVYLGAIALLLAPLSYLSRPATTEDSGGVLSQMRQEHRLSQAQLGEIDPAGASMNLATLGMRGVAANILWSKALYYKKTQDWTNMKAALNQITKLQPNFISVWRFQSWELAYNVAAEFDDFRHRYHWVKKGVDFLLEGIRYNRDEPRLVWDMGWFFGHKLGRSDDRRQFRRLYRTDTDFHDILPIDIDQTRGPDNLPDNWLTAWIWYRQAQRIVDTRNVPFLGKNPLIFHSDPALALIYYSIAIEDEGYLDEKGQEAWRRAGVAWTEYGNRTFATRHGYQVRLNDRERYVEEQKTWQAKLDDLVPGVRDEMVAKRRLELTEEERTALDTPMQQRSIEQIELALNAESKLNAPHALVAEKAPPENRDEALRLAKEATLCELLAQAISDLRVTVNFSYWKTRCEAEQEDTILQARKRLQQAEQLHQEAKLEQAQEMYELAWDAWAEIYDKYPILMDDPTAEDVVDQVNQYRDLLSRLEQRFPPPGFRLHNLLELHEQDYRAPIDEQSEDETIGTDQPLDSPADGPGNESASAGEDQETSDPEPSTDAATGGNSSDSSLVDSEER